MIQASIQHTEETCRRLSKVQYQKYDTTRKIIRWILGGLPIVLGFLFGVDTTIGVLFILFALFFLYKTANSYESEGNRAFLSTPEEFRHVDYEFHKKNMVIAAGGLRKTLQYNQVYALVEDEEYLYIFLNRQQAHMLSCKSVSDGYEKLKALLVEQTGKQWQMMSTKKSFIQTNTSH